MLKRPAIESSSLEAGVTNILHQVKASGDEALKRFSTIYDKVSVTELLVSKEEIDARIQQFVQLVSFDIELV